MTRRWPFQLLFLLLILLTVIVAFLFAIRPWYLNWGATPAEIAATLPGDDLVPNPITQTTRAITINTPAKDIYPWLIQIGQNKGGFYSYTLIENAIGCNITNADAINPVWQNTQPGDKVLMYPAGSGPTPYTVARLEPGRTFLLGHPPEGDTQGWVNSWAFVLAPIDDHITRFIMRDRSTLSGGIWDVIEPGVFLMQYGTLHGVKERAELAAGISPEPDWNWLILFVIAALVGVVAALRMWSRRERLSDKRLSAA